MGENFPNSPSELIFTTQRHLTFYLRQGKIFFFQKSIKKAHRCIPCCRCVMEEKKGRTKKRDFLSHTIFTLNIHWLIPLVDCMELIKYSQLLFNRVFQNKTVKVDNNNGKEFLSLWHKMIISRKSMAWKCDGLKTIFGYGWYMNYRHFSKTYFHNWKRGILLFVSGISL